MRATRLSSWQHWPDLLALAALAALVLLFHAPLAFTDAVLTDFDLFAYFYPYWEHRAASLRDGVLPLWNPYLFTGVPFLGNPQAAVLYPLNWPLSWLSAPRAVAYAYLFHLWLSGAGMCFLLRWSAGCRLVAAWLGGAVLALGGVLAAQAGHINQVQAAAWLPWLVLALMKGGLRWTIAGAMFYALAFLAGHPQQVFISSGGLALVVILSAAKNLRDRSGLRHALNPAIRLAVIVLGGLSLSGAQILPTLELSDESVRAGGLTYASAVSFSLPPPELLRSLLPTYGDQAASEYIAYAGVASLVLAWLGLWFGRQGYLFALMAGAGLFLAIGRFNPLYQLFYDYLPGFDFFRAPSRWLLLWGFGVAGLAGVGLNGLLEGWRTSRTRCIWAILTLVVPTGLSYALVRTTAPIIVPPWPAVAWWTSAALGAGALCLFPRRLAVTAGICLIVLAELFFARLPFPVSNPSPPAAYTSIRPALAHLLQDRGLHRVLTIADPGYAPGDMQELRASLPEFSPAQFQDLLAASKYREIMTPNLGLRFGVPSLDGYDGGLLPLKRYAEMKARLLETAGAPPSDDPADDEGEDLVIIRDRAMHVPDAGLLGNLNVKYVVADRLWDVWVDGVYHDLGAPQRLNPGTRLSIPSLNRSPVTAVSLVTYLEGAELLEQGTPLARVTLFDPAAAPVEHVLRAGIDSAESNSARLAAGRHSPARRVGDRRKDPQSGVYATRVDVTVPLVRLDVEALLPQGTLIVAGVAFVDARSGASYSPPLATSLRRVHTGDVKVYELTAFQSRARLARRLGAPDEPGIGRADILDYRPERVEVQAQASEPGFLVLNDTHYPGWRATLDGEPAEVLRAAGLFRAVAVPAGTHRVVFTFEPESLKAGIGLSLATVGLFVAVLVGRGLVPRRTHR